MSFTLGNDDEIDDVRYIAALRGQSLESIDELKNGGDGIADGGVDEVDESAIIEISAPDTTFSAPKGHVINAVEPSRSPRITFAQRGPSKSFVYSSEGSVTDKSLTSTSAQDKVILLKYFRIVHYVLQVIFYRNSFVRFYILCDFIGRLFLISERYDFYSRVPISLCVYALFNIFQLICVCTSLMCIHMVCTFSEKDTQAAQFYNAMHNSEDAEQVIRSFSCRTLNDFEKLQHEEREHVGKHALFSRSISSLLPYGSGLLSKGSRLTWCLRCLLKTVKNFLTFVVMDLLLCQWMQHCFGQADRRLKKTRASRSTAQRRLLHQIQRSSSNVFDSTVGESEAPVSYLHRKLTCFPPIVYLDEDMNWKMHSISFLWRVQFPFEEESFQSAGTSVSSRSEGRSDGEGNDEGKGPSKGGDDETNGNCYEETCTESVMNKQTAIRNRNNMLLRSIGYRFDRKSKHVVYLLVFCSSVFLVFCAMSWFNIRREAIEKQTYSSRPTTTNSAENNINSIESKDYSDRVRYGTAWVPDIVWLLIVLCSLLWIFICFVVGFALYWVISCVSMIQIENLEVYKRIWMEGLDDLHHGQQFDKYIWSTVSTRLGIINLRNQEEQNNLKISKKGSGFGRTASGLSSHVGRTGSGISNAEDRLQNILNGRNAEDPSNGKVFIRENSVQDYGRRPSDYGRRPSINRDNDDYEEITRRTSMGRRSSRDQCRNSIDRRRSSIHRFLTGLLPSHNLRNGSPPRGRLSRLGSHTRTPSPESCKANRNHPSLSRGSSYPPPNNKDGALPNESGAMRNKSAESSKNEEGRDGSRLKDVERQEGDVLLLMSGLAKKSDFPSRSNSESLWKRRTELSPVPSTSDEGATSSSESTTGVSQKPQHDSAHRNAARNGRRASIGNRTSIRRGSVGSNRSNRSNRSNGGYLQSDHRTIHERRLSTSEHMLAVRRRSLTPSTGITGGEARRVSTVSSRLDSRRGSVSIPKVTHRDVLLHKINLANAHLQDKLDRRTGGQRDGAKHRDSRRERRPSKTGSTPGIDLQGGSRSRGNSRAQSLARADLKFSERDVHGTPDGTIQVGSRRQSLNPMQNDIPPQYDNPTQGQDANPTQGQISIPRTTEYHTVGPVAGGSLSGASHFPNRVVRFAHGQLPGDSGTFLPIVDIDTQSDSVPDEELVSTYAKRDKTKSHSRTTTESEASSSASSDHSIGGGCNGEDTSGGNNGVNSGINDDINVGINSGSDKGPLQEASKFRIRSPFVFTLGNTLSQNDGDGSKEGSIKMHSGNQVHEATESCDYRQKLENCATTDGKSVVHVMQHSGEQGSKHRAEMKLVLKHVDSKGTFNGVSTTKYSSRDVLSDNHERPQQRRKTLERSGEERTSLQPQRRMSTLQETAFGDSTSSDDFHISMSAEVTRPPPQRHSFCFPEITEAERAKAIAMKGKVPRRNSGSGIAVANQSTLGNGSESWSYNALGNDLRNYGQGVVANHRQAQAAGVNAQVAASGLNFHPSNTANRNENRTEDWKADAGMQKPNAQGQTDNRRTTSTAEAPQTDEQKTILAASASRNNMHMCQLPNLSADEAIFRLNERVVFYENFLKGNMESSNEIFGVYNNIIFITLSFALLFNILSISTTLGSKDERGMFYSIPLMMLLVVCSLLYLAWLRAQAAVHEKYTRIVEDIQEFPQMHFSRRLYHDPMAVDSHLLRLSFRMSWRIMGTPVSYRFVNSLVSGFLAGFLMSVFLPTVIG